MRRITKIVAVGAVLAAVIVGVSLFSLYEAYQQIPEFYHEALAKDDVSQEPARDAFVAQATALASDLRRAGHWHTLFTAEQINAWLALELKTNYPELLPDEWRDPRISLREKEARIACRYINGELSTVLSLTLEAYLSEPNVLALRIRSARAGALPVPLAKVLESISHAARELHLRLEWRKLEGDPVALISFPSPGRPASEQVNLEALELRDGELFVSGTIGPAPSIRIPGEKPPAGAPTASNDKPADTSPDEAAEPDQPLVGSAEKETRQK